MTPATEARSSAQRATAAGLAAASAAGALWGTGALVVAVLIGTFGMTPPAISFWRFALGSAVLLVLFGRGLVRNATRGRLLLAGAAGAGMAGYVLCWFLGIERLGAAVPTLIALCLPPVLVTAWGAARGSLRVDAALLVLLAAAVGGTALVLAPAAGVGVGDGAVRDAGNPAAPGGALAGIGLAVASAVLYALVSLVSGRLSAALGAGPSAAGMSVAATAVTALAAPFVALGWPADPGAAPLLAYLGIATTTVALLAFAWGAARLTPTALTVATLVEPLTAVVLAALLLGEPLAPVEWVGAVLLLGALVGLGRRRAVTVDRTVGG